MNALKAIQLPSRLGLLALMGSGGLLLGALYFQYFMDLPPCELCYWQRYPHVVAAFAGTAALVSYRYPRLALVLVMVAITALIATSAIGLYHTGVEYRWWQGPQSCTGNVPTGLTVEQLKKYLFGAKMVRCDETAWSMWGLSMAAWNALISAALAFVLSSGVANWVRTQK